MGLIDSTSGLVQDELGVWKSSCVDELAYPDDGHQQCFQVEDASFWFQHRNNCIVSAVKQFPPEGILLDVGGGNGFVTRRLIDEGFDAALCEPGSVGAYNAKTYRHIPQVICATLEEAGFGPASLEAVGCFDVIEHIEDDSEFINSIHKVLAPGGRLYATVPAHKWLWSASDVYAEHYRRYTKTMISELLGNKFDVEYFTFFFTALTPVIFLLRTLPFKFGLCRKDHVGSSEAEHGVKQSAARSLIDWLLHYEWNRIDAQKSIRFGASCLFVARKKMDCL